MTNIFEFSTQFHFSSCRLKWFSSQGFSSKETGQMFSTKLSRNVKPSTTRTWTRLARSTWCSNEDHSLTQLSKTWAAIFLSFLTLNHQQAETTDLALDWAWFWFCLAKASNCLKLSRMFTDTDWKESIVSSIPLGQNTRMTKLKFMCHALKFRRVWTWKRHWRR